MAYLITDRRDSTTTTVDCLYDLNSQFNLGLIEPDDGDLHLLDENVELILNSLGYAVDEI
jgi:hypothetical protein